MLARHYLRFKHFTIFTDHKPLLALMTIDTRKDASGKRTRWALELSSYDFTIKYKAGSKHGDADALSRADHADEPSGDPRDEEDLVTLGACEYGEAAAFELVANEELRLRIFEA